MSNSRTFRDRMRQLCPPWLQRGNNERLLYAIALQVDVFGEALLAGVKLRFPNLYSAESLPLIGRERRIARGSLEPDATYAARLTRWLDDHRMRGGPYALLAQLHAFYAPDNFPVDLIYRNGRRYHMAADGTVTRSDASTFSPDADAARWARWWLFLYTDAYPTPTPEQLAALRLVPRAWNAAHCAGSLVVMPTGAELWNFPLGRTWNESGTWNTTAPSAVLPID